MSANAQQDDEKGMHRNGYPALAKWIAASPDYESFIFRKFDRLSARNILHLESQLIILERKLDSNDEEAYRSTDIETGRSIRSWEAFEENAVKTPSRLEHDRMNLVNEINEKIKQYHEALLLQLQIAAMGKPRALALIAIRDWFDEKKAQLSRYMNQRAVLGGRAKGKFEDAQDLVALRRPADKDMLSRFLQDHWMFKTTRAANQTEHINEQHVVWVVVTISTVLAAILLVGAMVGLHFTQKESTWLGLNAGFTVLFALSVVLLTNARRADIFAATAAYAAVLVVFVSGDLGGSNNCSDVSASLGSGTAGR